MNLTLCLTHACNLACAYCYAGRKFRRTMAWDTACRAIDFGFEQTQRGAVLAGRPPRCQLGFFGGEPLLEWDLLQRATGYAEAEAERRGIRLVLTVTTNMTLLDGGRADWLKAHGFHVGLSLDGNAAMHDTLRRFRNGRGSHAVCARALAFFTESEARAEVIMVPDPRNLRHLADSVEWLAGQGAPAISLNPNFDADWSAPVRRQWRRVYERIGRFYADRFRAGRPVKINVLDGKIRTQLKEGFEACDRCGFGEREAAVAASGNLYPCERVVGDDTDTGMRMGTVFAGFDGAQRARILAARGCRTAACRDCVLRARCMNWCGCINYATTGATDQVAGVVCFHERMTAAVADAVAAALYGERNRLFLDTFYS